MIFVGFITNAIGLWILRRNGRLIGVASGILQAFWIFSGGYLLGAILFPPKGEASDVRLDQAFGSLRFAAMPIGFAIVFGFFRLMEMDTPSPNVPPVLVEGKQRLGLTPILHLCALVGFGLGSLLPNL